MDSLIRLKNKLKNKILGIILMGKSVQDLEEKIYKLEKFNICWATVNYCEIVENYILSKINKKINILVDCTPSTTKEYELKYRIPEWKEIIKRNDLVVSHNSLVEKRFKDYGINDFYGEYKDKMIMLDELFPYHIEGSPNNSISWLLYCGIVGEAKQIITFGMDGSNFDEKEKETYYKQDLVFARKTLANPNFPQTLTHNSVQMNDYLQVSIDFLIKNYNIKYMPKIVNCSDSSMIDCFKKISYGDLMQYVI